MQTTRTLARQWTSHQALLLVTSCLALGIVVGWFIRGFQGTSKTPPPQIASQSIPASAAPANRALQSTDPAQLKRIADEQAGPLMAKLNADPKNPDILTSIANLYYDAQQYSTAIDYYSRSLLSRPADASVRTDMATAYWYLGNADQAIAEFNKALTYAPTNPNTLFNRGLVKWKGKHDSAGAIADWKKLLDANPDYDQREKVRQMLADVEKQSTGSAATKG